MRKDGFGIDKSKISEDFGGDGHLPRAVGMENKRYGRFSAADG